MTPRYHPRPCDDELVKLFYDTYTYDMETGDLRWRRTGKEAGHGDGSGYRSICLGGQRYKLHRIVWLLHTGTYPDGAMDHINGDRTDNRIANLRIATAAQNVHNRIKAGKYPTGVYKGPRGRYVARIQVPGASTKIYLGYYDTPELAAAAYAGASIVLHGEYAAALCRPQLVA